MSDLSEQLRDNAREWDISECPQRAEIARAAADRLDQLEAELAKYELRVITRAGKYIEGGYIVSKEPGGEFEWEWLDAPMTVYVKRED